MKIIFLISVLFLVGCMRFGDNNKRYHQIEPLEQQVPQSVYIPHQPIVISKESNTQLPLNQGKEEIPVVKNTMSIKLTNNEKKEEVKNTNMNYDNNHNKNKTPYKEDGKWVYLNSKTGEKMSISHKLNIK